MPDITWQARDYLGRLVEVTGETEEGSTAVRVSPQELEAGGGVQTIRRIGPIVVAFDTVPDYTLSGGDNKMFLMGALTNGSWVIRTSIHKLTRWNDTTEAVANIRIDDGAGNVGEVVGAHYDIKAANFVYGPTNDYPVTGAGHPGGAGTDATIAQSESADVVVRGEGLSLWCQVYETDGDATTGLIHAYALVAEPAA